MVYHRLEETLEILRPRIADRGLSVRSQLDSFGLIEVILAVEAELGRLLCSEEVERLLIVPIADLASFVDSL